MCFSVEQSFRMGFILKEKPGSKRCSKQQLDVRAVVFQESEQNSTGVKCVLRFTGSRPRDGADRDARRPE